jgi:hypothetical protein
MKPALRRFLYHEIALKDRAEKSSLKHSVNQSTAVAAVKNAVQAALFCFGCVCLPINTMTERLIYDSNPQNQSGIYAKLGAVSLNPF